MTETRNARHALLPECNEELTLDSLNTGDEVWTVPWAMWVDSDRRCWLHPKYTAHLAPGGTVQMRVALREDGYHAWLAPDHRYTPSETPGFTSSADTEYLPVVELHHD